MNNNNNILNYVYIKEPHIKNQPQVNSNQLIAISTIHTRLLATTKELGTDNKKRQSIPTPSLIPGRH